MAQFISEIYSDEQGYSDVCRNFKPFGLCKEIGILTPENKLITKGGTVDVSGLMSFEYEAAQGEYISGRTEDLLNDSERLIRSTVPVIAPNGETVAVLYGVIDAKELKNHFEHQICLNRGFSLYH